MENLIIEKGDKTPGIDFNTNGDLRITGRSVPENPMAFFSPILSWLEEYTRTHPQATTLHMNLEYFNTSSGKMFLNVMKYMEYMMARGADVKVQWYYLSDDEEIAEAGHNYEHLVKIPFRFVEIL
jgi:hypothetical protein